MQLNIRVSVSVGDLKAIVVLYFDKVCVAIKNEVKNIEENIYK